MTRVAFLCDKLDMKGIADRLRRARIAAGFRSASSAAITNDWTVSTYRAHENGQNNFGLYDAVNYGRAFDAGATWLCGFGDDEPILPFSASEVPGKSRRLLDFGDDTPPANKELFGFVNRNKNKRHAEVELSQPDELSNLAADIPVYGTAMGGDGDEDFNLNGDVVNYVRRPHGIARMRGVFGIYVQGDSMSPRHRAGELRYVTSAQAPGIGDDIILEIFGENHRHEDGVEPSARGILKELVRRTSETYIVRQHNPPREFEIERSRIKRVFRVLTTNDLLG